MVAASMADAAAPAATEPALTDLDKVALVSTADPELTFIFEEVGMELEWQYAIIKAGYAKLRRFANIDDTRAGAREAIQAATGLDSTSGAPARLAMAIFMDAWETARASAAKDIQIRAEAKAMNQLRPVSVNERLSMRRVIEQLHGKLPDDEVPGPTYLSFKIDEVEQNDPHAAPLDELASLEDSAEFDISLGVDNLGAFRAMRRKVKITMPTSPEQLRKRLRVEGALWMMLGARFTNRPWLAGLTPEVFGRYTDYVLGKRVADLEIVLTDGTTGGGRLALQTPRPPWALVIAYEFQMRKAALKMVRECGETLASAMVAVTRDSELKEMYFTTPLALLPPAAKRPKASLPEPLRTPHRIKTKGKGQGKAVKGKNAANGLTSRTPDGRSICFAFNNEGCDGKCGMAHVCRVKGCYQKHPMAEHPSASGEGGARASSGN